MAFYVYILQCGDGSYYTGQTDNLEKRLSQHRTRYFTGCYTATRQPVQLVFQQPFASRYEAIQAERRIRGWNRSKKECLIRGDWNFGKEV